MKMELLEMYEKFKNIRKFSTKIMVIFGSSYLCKQLLSFMNQQKFYVNKVYW